MTNQSEKMKVVRMAKPIPETESERLEEAKQLLAKLKTGDRLKLTTWELTLVEELGEGKACTRIRLKELRAAIERLYPTT